MGVFVRELITFKTIWSYLFRRFKAVRNKGQKAWRLESWKAEVIGIKHKAKLL